MPEKEKGQRRRGPEEKRTRERVREERLEGDDAY